MTIPVEAVNQQPADPEWVDLMLMACRMGMSTNEVRMFLIRAAFVLQNSKNS